MVIIAFLCGLCIYNCNNNKLAPRVIYSELKKYFQIHLHSSTFAQTRLVTRARSSVFAYKCLVNRVHSTSDPYALVPILLHWSTIVYESFIFFYESSLFSYTRLVTRLYFLEQIHFLIYTDYGKFLLDMIFDLTQSDLNSSKIYLIGESLTTKLK